MVSKVLLSMKTSYFQVIEYDGDGCDENPATAETADNPDDNGNDDGKTPKKGTRQKKGKPTDTETVFMSDMSSVIKTFLASQSGQHQGTQPSDCVVLPNNENGVWAQLIVKKLDKIADEKADELRQEMYNIVSRVARGYPKTDK